MLDVGEPGDHGRMLLTQVLDHLVLDPAYLLALGDEVAVLDADVPAAYTQHGFLLPVASLP